MGGSARGNDDGDGKKSEKRNVTIFVDAFTRADVGYRSVERNPRHCPLFIVFSSFIVALRPSIRPLVRTFRRALFPRGFAKRANRRRTAMKSSDIDTIERSAPCPSLDLFSLPGDDARQRGGCTHLGQRRLQSLMKSKISIVPSKHHHPLVVRARAYRGNLQSIENVRAFSRARRPPSVAGDKDDKGERAGRHICVVSFPSQCTSGLFTGVAQIRDLVAPANNNNNGRLLLPP